MVVYTTTLNNFIWNSIPNPKCTNLQMDERHFSYICNTRVTFENEEIQNFAMVLSKNYYVVE